MTTLYDALHQAVQELDKTSPSAHLDSEVLLMHLLNRDRSFLYAWPEKKLTADQIIRLRSLVARRASGIPVAHITGQKEFWSREFAITPDVLIPRPETEGLVELALARIPCNETHRIADVGTGSGAIAVTLAAERPNSHILATDACRRALAVAKMNAATHGLSNIAFCLTDWLRAASYACFHMIVSNPPYIADSDPHLEQGDVRAEPRLALMSDDNGLYALTTIAQQARTRLRSNGHLLLEHGYGQSDAVHGLLSKLGYVNIIAHSDLQGHLRVTSAQLNF